MGELGKYLHKYNFSIYINRKMSELVKHLINIIK